jgi:hypothetical protein
MMATGGGNGEAPALFVAGIEACVGIRSYREPHIHYLP